MHTDMHNLMLGMFWGGMLLAAPPLLVGAALAVMIWRRRDPDNTSADLPVE
jgi:hypothetical protein